MDKLSLGRHSEEIAARFLQRHSFKIIERNFSCKSGELDIIAKDKYAFVFIEVRSARDSLFHNPVDSLTPLKIRRITILAQIWLKKNRLYEVPVRFDVIGITHTRAGSPYIKHIKDAF